MLSFGCVGNPGTFGCGTCSTGGDIIVGGCGCGNDDSGGGGGRILLTGEGVVGICVVGGGLGRFVGGGFISGSPNTPSTL